LLVVFKPRDGIVGSPECTAYSGQLEVPLGLENLPQEPHLNGLSPFFFCSSLRGKTASR
jgi:hypothetical protein